MTALEHPARDGTDGPSRPPARVPFPVVDEVARHCLQEEEPETVHIEVHLPGRLDPARLTAAFTQALHRHPRILMREAAGPWYRRRYEWELTPDPDVEVVSFPPPGPGALQHARTRALLTAPPLSASPPIRLEVVDGAGPPVGSEATDAVGTAPPRSAAPRPHTGPRPKGTVLFLTVNHTALDGPACLRVLATAAQLYGGKDNSPAAPPVRPPEAATKAAQVDTPSTWTPPARVAHGTPEPSPGNGLLVTELGVPHRPKGSPYTVNDQLMAATALMIAHWNREHGARPRPCASRCRSTTAPAARTCPSATGHDSSKCPSRCRSWTPDGWASCCAARRNAPAPSSRCPGPSSATARPS